MQRTTTLLAATLLAALSTTPALAAKDETTLAQIKKTQTIKLGFRESAPPFSFTGGDGKQAGYSVELCQRVANSVRDELKLSTLKIEWKPVTSSNRFEALKKREIDLECATSTKTLSRMQDVSFSLTTFIDGASLLTKAGSNYSNNGDLNGRTIGVLPGTTTEKAVKQVVNQNQLSTKVLEVKNHEDGFSLLRTGQIDAYAADRTVLIASALSDRNGTAFALADVVFSYEPMGLVSRYGDPEFQLVVDKALARLYRSGDVAEIYRRWLGGLGEPTPLLKAMYALQSLPE
ncbi:MAG: amino acid ABC transporter substrate-binding protein [Chitinivorax sp.]|jgi:ABC-type amino acid transport substrate-binding protein